MGKMKEHPRYNIISVRISDRELAELNRIRNARPLSGLLLEAVNNLIIAEQQNHYDRHLQSHVP